MFVSTNKTEQRRCANFSSAFVWSGSGTLNTPTLNAFMRMERSGARPTVYSTKELFYSRCNLHAHSVDDGVEHLVNDGNKARGGVIAVLEFDNVGKFFVDVYAGNTVAHVVKFA